MADNYLEKKFEDMKASKNGMTKEERARRDAWKKRMEAGRRMLEEERASASTHSFAVAGHVFNVTVPSAVAADVHLQPYMPFAVPEVHDPLFSLRVELVDSLSSVPAGRVRECLNEEAPYFWIMEKNGRFNFAFSYSKSRRDCILIPSLEYTDNVLFIQRDSISKIAGFALSNALMLLYTYRTAPYDTLMVHASVISNDDGGYMFLGRSGTGKSTHSRLWLENVEGSDLLNDDNPVIRIIEGNPFVFGTPWSGKTPCYKNESMPLKAVVRLSQAPHNKIERLSVIGSFASLMPSCSCIRWDRNAVDALHSAVEKVVTKVGGWHLECLPDQDAALLCHSEITRNDSRI